LGANACVKTKRMAAFLEWFDEYRHPVKYALEDRFHLGLFSLRLTGMEFIVPGLLRHILVSLVEGTSNASINLGCFLTLPCTVTGIVR
jgi:hypothetical protein